MSSPSASTSLISPAVLAAQAYVPKLDMFLASLTNVGPGADQKTVVGAMKVFEKWLWHKGQAVEVTWSRKNELREECMVRYVENAGVAWLVPFEVNFAPAPPSIDKQLASLLVDDGLFMLWTELFPNSKVAAYIEPLVQMDLARQERKWVEAAAQSAAIMLAEQEAELLEEWRVALAELLAKCMANVQAAGFLEVVEVGAITGGEVVGMEEAAAGGPAAAEGLAVPMVEVAAAEPADEFEAPEEDDEAEDEDKVPVTPKRVLTAGSSGQLPVVIKRASKSTTPSKQRAQKVVPQYEPLTATTFTDAQLHNLLVPCQDEVVLDDNRHVGENVPGIKGKKTASLVACNNCKLHKESCNKCWADNDPKLCWYLTGAQPCYRCNALKRASGSSQQIIPIDPIEPVLCPGSMVLSDLESPSGAEGQSNPEETVELSNSSESLLEVLAVPQHAVQPNYAPLPIPRVDRQEFLWLGKMLNYPISTLCPAQYIEAANEKVAGMAEVMWKDMQAAAVEMEGLWLQKKIMEKSVNILERYQADCAEALEWQEANKTHLQQPFATLFLLLPGASLDP
ncbi:hypothetical protein C0992_003029 [Termitomyces sp. T32_za158]|nr:hypothetical protein C0992_003029 [Termitomyces sp. T32_za158]